MFYDIFQINEIVKHWLLISLILINIVGQASLDDQSTICQVSIRRDTHTLTQRVLDPNRALLYATGDTLLETQPASLYNV